MTAEAPTKQRWTAALEEVCRLRTPDGAGWSPRMRRQFGYFTPDEWYEAVVSEMVGGETEWLDVGCGRDLFPFNELLSHKLASRCQLLVGLDPSDNIDDNQFVHERVKCLLQEYKGGRQFDLVTLRMVAEHITDPQAAISALVRLTKPGGRVVIYTVSKWSPASLVAAATPMSVHHFAKRILWKTQPRDTFPTAYRMNTRRALLRLFREAGFVEETFLKLDDCRSFGRWRPTLAMELSLQYALRSLGIPYPELCLLGVYRKEGAVERPRAMARA